MIVATLGWVGAALSLVAYYAVSRKLIAPDSMKYQSMTMGGAGLLMVACAWSAAWPSFLTNLIFLLVGVRIVFGAKREFVKRLMRDAGSRILPSRQQPAEIAGIEGLGAGGLGGAAHNRDSELEARRVQAGMNCSSLGCVNGATVVNVIPASVSAGVGGAHF